MFDRYSTVEELVNLKLDDKTKDYICRYLKDAFHDLNSDEKHYDYGYLRWQLYILSDLAFSRREWIDHIPELQFPSEWKIKIVPPFSGALIRFEVRHNGHWVSVYLDCYDMLGSINNNREPYWEIYPYEDDDIHRIPMNDTEELMNRISYALTLEETIREEANKKSLENENQNLQIGGNEKTEIL